MAFSAIPSTFFGRGYFAREPRIYVAIDNVTDYVFSMGDSMVPNTFVQDGSPVYLKLDTGTWDIVGISQNTVYFARDVLYYDTGSIDSHLKFKLALTAGGAAIALTGTTTYAIASMLPVVCFIADTSALSPAVTGASSVEVLQALTATSAHESTGDFRYILIECFKAFHRCWEAVTLSNRSKVIRMDKEQYQQGFDEVVTRSYRQEFDLVGTTSSIQPEP